MRIIFISLILFFLICSNCYAGFGDFQQLNHEIKNRNDGGFTIVINGTIQHFKPITSEGFFPKEKVNYQIELVGRGKDWSYRNQLGYYYAYPGSIECKKPHWDIGYAWIDEKKEYIYLNFYWIKSPDSLEESKINGKYKIKE